MLNSKTERYPWQCFCCDGIFESNNDPAVIWVTELPEALVLFACYGCEDQTHVEEIVCAGCFQTYTAVYHEGHDNVVCNCGHVHDLWNDDDRDCGEFDGENP